MISRAYKTEVSLTEKQLQKFLQTIGVCRYVYNLFVEINDELYDLYEGDQPYVDSYEFSKWLNNGYKTSFPDEQWIYKVSSKAIRYAIDTADKAYRSFMMGKTGHPRYKKKFVNDCSMYFVRNCAYRPIKCDRHRIFIPTLGWVKLKEKGYLPWGNHAGFIISGTLSRRAGRYFVSVIVKEEDVRPDIAVGDPIGVDLGIEKFATLSDGRIIPNFNKTSKHLLFLERKLKRLNRKAARQLDQWKSRRKKDSHATRKNLNKTYDEIRKVNYRLDCLRSQFIFDAIHEVTRTKPSYIVIEDLNVKGMLKNRYLSYAIKSLRFNDFKQRLIQNCKRLGIEVRIADRWFPSSKMCSVCGEVKMKLPLSMRTFYCHVCGNILDRDLNAAMNLMNTTEFSLAT